MGKITDQISQDLVEAMKAKDELKTSTLRLLVSSFKNKQIEVGHELSDSEAQDVAAKAAKQRRESIEAYKKGGREDLVSREEAELEVINVYLPEQMSEVEIVKIVEQVITEVGAAGAGDLGRVMSEVMKRLQGKADGAVVSGIVREKLA